MANKKHLYFFLVCLAFQTALGVLDGYQLLPDFAYEEANGFRQVISILVYPGYLVFKGPLTVTSWIYFFLLNLIPFILIFLPCFWILSGHKIKARPKA